MAQDISSNNNKTTNDINFFDSNKIVIFTSVKSLLHFEDKSKTPLSSTTHEISGLSWRMEVQKGALPRKLDLYVFCNENVKDGTLWLCKVQFTVSNFIIEQPTTNAVQRFTLSTHKRMPTSSVNYGPVYGFNTYYWILENFFDQNLERKDEPVQIKLDIEILCIQKSFPALDTTLAIKIGENRTESFFINKHLLGSFSKYFGNLFFGDCSDNKKAQNYFEINETEDFDPLAFGFMIYSLMTMGGMIQESNFLQDGHYPISIRIIELAIKYDVAFLVDYCETFLIGCKNSSKMDMLELAEQYSLKKLMEHCLNEVSFLDFMKDFTKSAEIHSHLSKNTQKQLNAILEKKSRAMQTSLMALNTIFGSSNSKNHPFVSTSMTEIFNKIMTVLLGEQQLNIIKATIKPE